MTEDIRSPVTPYVIAGVTFHQWITDRSKDEGTSRYEWRGESLGRTLIVGRYLGRSDCWVMVDGKPVRGLFTTLGQGMRAAVNAAERRKAA